MIKEIDSDDKGWPKLLRQVNPKLKQLYYRGKWQEMLFDRCIAVVGSRRMTHYGERVLEKIIPVLVEAKVTVVSGLMYGIDQAAHEMCLECGGKAIAVLGWGIGWQMAENELLIAKRIIDSGGLLISEWAEQVPALWTFPQRNRIVAGLAQATLVVEAGEKSGSLITAQLAQKFKRKLLAIPGPMTSKVSVGTNQLIKSGQAAMVTSGGDVLLALGWQSGLPGSDPGNEPDGEMNLLLQSEGLTVDELAKKLGRGVEAVGAELSLMALQGKVKEIEGKYFVI